MTVLKGDSAVTPQAIPPHGPLGLFNQPGTSPGVTSAMIAPIPGLEGFLEANGHVRLTQELNPVHAILTGQTANSGSEPTSECDETAPRPGNLKLCHQAWPFGLEQFKSDVIQVDLLGSYVNRSEPMDLRLLQNPFDTSVPNGFAPTNPQDIFANQLTKAIVEAMNGVRFQYGANFYTGTGTSPRYNGLERLVNTGYRDIYNPAALCTAADSLVIDAGNTIIQNTANATVIRFINAVRDRMYRAEQTRVLNVRWVAVMRRQKFLAYADVWPCQFNTYNCGNATPASTTNFNDGERIRAMRTDMYNRRYLLVDNVEIPVLFDDYLPEFNIGSGVFESDTYIIPISSSSLSDTNGQALYVEYFDHRGRNGMASVLGNVPAGVTNLNNEYSVTPDGRYAIFWLGGTAFCKEVLIRARKRVILRLPWLAIRITNEQYNVYIHEASPTPGTSFHVNGGATSFLREFGSPLSS